MAQARRLCYAEGAGEGILAQGRCRCYVEGTGEGTGEMPVLANWCLLRETAAQKAISTSPKFIASSRLLRARVGIQGRGTPVLALWHAPALHSLGAAFGRWRWLLRFFF
ncbi:hypothetical protein [Kamptonema formosum]|uniref:hypothetical protein n=1 Tax=Kamptonema formosum TaxID=331992 RepID=UPI0003466ACC|nr:hypothetical protein [Oscillatoria sp. PCC 10802]